MDIVFSSLFEWIGECPYWDVRTQELSMVDACIARGSSRILRWNPLTSGLKSFVIDQCASFNIPASEKDFSIFSSKNKVFKCNWNQETSENHEFLFQVDEPLNRFNDAKCDKQGILIAGTMRDEKSPGVDFNSRGGSIFGYRNGAENAVNLGTGFDLSNGIDWSNDGSQMFFADSIARIVYAFDYNNGNIGNKRSCLDFSKYSSLDIGLPDGMTMDIKDKLWVACFLIGKLVQFDLETGVILQEIKFPTAGTTSCCFGGPQLTDLYVTSSKFGVEDDPSKGIKHSGSLFRIPASVHGTQGHSMNYFQM